MNIVIVTDAWMPQVNGVVTTLVELVKQLRVMGHEVTVIDPYQFKTRPCFGYPGIDLAVRPAKQLKALLDPLEPDAVHIATEGPLGWAARSYCKRRGWAFTTAFHTKFPEILKAAVHIPLWLGYAIFRHFHQASSGVMAPTLAVKKSLESRGFANVRQWTHGVDTDFFNYVETAVPCELVGDLPRPIYLYVGRVSYEKNISAFLDLDLRQGSKVVCGEGPVLDTLRKRYTGIQWLGVLPRTELVRVYQAADVFVFPSKADTFGLVILEAMSCGTPVAAYPTDGPLEIFTGPLAKAMQADLAQAVTQALTIPRALVKDRAMAFAWQQAVQLFLQNLVTAKIGQGKNHQPARS